MAGIAEAAAHVLSRVSHVSESQPRGSDTSTEVRIPQYEGNEAQGRRAASEDECYPGRARADDVMGG